jgi:hypothetical protein
MRWLRWLLAGAALIAIASALALRFAGGAPGGERTATDAVATDDAPPAAPGGSAAQTRSRQDAVAAAGAAGAAAPAAGQTPRTILDERFAARPLNWPDDPASTAWFDGVDGGGYRLVAREPSRFVAVGAPHSAPLGDVVVQAAFRKVGGPAGGGYGIIVRDQGPGPRDGVHQGGRYYVLEAGDRGEVGIWRREGDRWVDLLPWTASGAVRPGSEPNELEVRAMGPHLSFFVNGALAASVIDTELTAGRVGVFVGGDLNEVVLDRFVVQAPIP